MVRFSLGCDPTTRRVRNPRQYRCCFLNENDQVVRIEELVSCGDDETRREAMFLLAETGRIAAYELWRNARKVDEFKLASTPDLRTSEVEAKLCRFAPVDELAYRYFFRDYFSYYRRDPVWIVRIAELEERLDADGRARACTLAADPTWTLPDKF
jgi:hypothetical protein